MSGTVHELFPGAGHGTGLIRDILPAGEIVRRMATEASQALERAGEVLS